jgi:hypothetical protein
MSRHVGNGEMKQTLIISPKTDETTRQVQHYGKRYDLVKSYPDGILCKSLESGERIFFKTSTVTWSYEK